MKKFLIIISSIIFSCAPDLEVNDSIDEFQFSWRNEKLTEIIQSYLAEIDTTKPFILQGFVCGLGDTIHLTITAAYSKEFAEKYQPFGVVKLKRDRRLYLYGCGIEELLVFNNLLKDDFDYKSIIGDLSDSSVISMEDVPSWGVYVSDTIITEVDKREKGPYYSLPVDTLFFENR